MSAERKCFMSVAGCNNEVVGVRVINSMGGGFALRHEDIEVLHCKDHAEQPVGYEVTKIRREPYQYPEVLFKLVTPPR